MAAVGPPRKAVPSGNGLTTAGYLDLAMREYLAMRDEMNGLFRLEVSLVTTALVVVGGAVAAAATNIANLSADQLAVGLQVTGTFGLVVFFVAIGVANMFIVLEEYVTLAAKEIEVLGRRGSSSNLGTVQSRIRRWTRSRRPEDLLAWFISYGTTQITALVVLVVVFSLALVGFTNGSSSGGLACWRTLFGWLDAFLAVVCVLELGLSLAYINSWDRVMRLPGP